MQYTPFIYSEFLNEEVHVSYVFDNILDKICNKIRNHYQLQKLNTEYTKFLYDPSIKETIYNDDFKFAMRIGYPIMIGAFVDSPDHTLYLDTSINDKIVLLYNTNWIKRTTTDNNKIKEVLKHEFLHVVETFLNGKVLSKGSNYNIQVFNIDTFLYLLNSSEINARINQAAYILENMSQKEIEKMISNIAKDIENEHPLNIKYKVIEGIIRKLESTLNLEFIKKFIIEIVHTYNDKCHTQDNDYITKGNLSMICQYGYYLKKHNIIKRTKENYDMINSLPDNLDDVRIFTTQLSVMELDLLAFNIINLLEWYITKINKRITESIYHIIEERKGIDILECI